MSRSFFCLEAAILPVYNTLLFYLLISLLRQFLVVGYGKWLVQTLRYPLGHSLYFYFTVVLLVVVKEFFGTKIVSSGEESLTDLFHRYLSLGYGKTLSQCMICSFTRIYFYVLLFFILV